MFPKYEKFRYNLPDWLGAGEPLSGTQIACWVIVGVGSKPRKSLREMHILIREYGVFRVRRHIIYLYTTGGVRGTSTIRLRVRGDCSPRLPIVKWCS